MSVLDLAQVERVARQLVAWTISPREPRAIRRRRRCRQQGLLHAGRRLQALLHPCVGSRQLVGRALQGELRLHARQDDPEVDRLGHVIVRAELERGDDVLALVLGRGHNDRQVRRGVRLPDNPQHLEAVDTGHHDVQQHDVVLSLPDHVERRLTAVGGVDRVSPSGEAAGEHVPVHLVVVDDEQVSDGRVRLALLLPCAHHRRLSVARMGRFVSPRARCSGWNACSLLDTHPSRL